MTRPDEITLSDRDRLQDLLTAKSKLDRGALRCYRPLPNQLAFHQSMATEVILRGGNRSGKTTTAAANFAALALNKPIIGTDGSEVWPYRNPERVGQPMLMWMIGYDQRHIGQTLHRVLFEPGLFQIIRDEKTGEWRSYQPWIAADRKRARESRPAEPLIPESEIDQINWIAYGQKIIESVYLKNGNKICAYASTGKPKQGDAVDIIWIDEDVEHSMHIGEWQARLSDRQGRLFWSAFPHSKNNALILMSERATEQVGLDNPDVQEFVLKYRDNPWIDDNEKRKRISGWSYEEARARDLGEFTFDTVLMYDWSPAIQGVPNALGADCPINRYWDKYRALPDNWTRYLVLDPGHQTTAVVVFAVPPPKGEHMPLRDEADDWGNVIVVEDEIYLHKATCHDTARTVWERHGTKKFEAFVIDMHAGRQTPMGGAKTIKTQYTEAFEMRGLRCRRTGCGFAYGSDNVEARREILRTWMQPREGAGSKFRAILDRTPNLQREFKTYRKRIVSDDHIEDEPAKSAHDAIDCCEYAAAFNPKWVRPEGEAVMSRAARVMTMLDKFFDNRNPKEAGYFFGPGNA